MSYTREVVELDDDEKAIDHAVHAIQCGLVAKNELKWGRVEKGIKMVIISAFWARKAMMRNHIGSNISIEEMIKQANQK